VAILGAFAFSEATQDETDEAMEIVIKAGVNHIDVAPTYGDAEERLGPWLARERERFFVGGKTTERTRDGAAWDMRESLERLQIGQFDLYQLHAVNSVEELEEATRPSGALQAVLEARGEGLTRFVGITGHGLDAPTVFIEALSRFDFDSVLFPVSFVLYADGDYRRRAEELIRQCRSRDTGTMAIKSIAKALWSEDASRPYNTWYEPFDEAAEIQEAVDFALSQKVTGLCTAGDPQLLTLFLQACEAFEPMDGDEQEGLMTTADEYEPIFT
jgi:aryl-alcohol dehydrogenase-like predicted oxidoreductase